MSMLLDFLARSLPNLPGDEMDFTSNFTNPLVALFVKFPLLLCSGRPPASKIACDLSVDSLLSLLTSLVRISDCSERKLEKIGMLTHFTLNDVDFADASKLVGINCKSIILLETEKLIMEPDRLNSPVTFSMTMEVLGHELQFSQDPNSKHLGTTVWDASLVFVKFLEKNSRKGKFSPSKLKGKRVIELGAGCGFAGFGMALLGCDVIATDQKEVLPLLTRNVERNTSRIMQTNPDSFGSIQAAELDWGNKDHIQAIGPPLDFIIGTDVVYAEHLLEPLLQTIFALSGPKTSIVLGYEIRSTNVHERMLKMWKRSFELKIVPKSKMDSQYQHPSIQLYIMGIRPQAESSCLALAGTNQKKSENVEEDERKIDDLFAEKVGGDGETQKSVRNKSLSDWEARRIGSMAARLLRDVNIS